MKISKMTKRKIRYINLFFYLVASVFPPSLFSFFFGYIKLRIKKKQETNPKVIGQFHTARALHVDCPIVAQHRLSVVQCVRNQCVVITGEQNWDTRVDTEGLERGPKVLIGFK